MRGRKEKEKKEIDISSEDVLCYMNELNSEEEMDVIVVDKVLIKEEEYYMSSNNIIYKKDGLLLGEWKDGKIKEL